MKKLSIDKNVVKEIMDMGGTITLPHKANIDAIFDNVTIYYDHNDKVYVISHNMSNNCEGRRNFDSAYLLFSKYFNNMGLVMLAVIDENPELDLEVDWDILKTICKREYEKLN
jgi:hypothetical protein